MRHGTPTTKTILSKIIWLLRSQINIEPAIPFVKTVNLNTDGFFIPNCYCSAIIKDSVLLALPLETRKHRQIILTAATGIPMNNFTFSSVKTIISELNSIQQLPQICQKFHVNRILLVTDPGIKSLGLLDSSIEQLQQANFDITLFSEVEADPSEQVLTAAITLAKSRNIELVIGFGGGSSLDIAKLVSFLANPQCSQTLNEIYGVDQAKGGRLPLIQIPTTAGTGSEVTAVAIITTGETTKKGAVSPLFLPDIALLDANLTLGLPPSITAATGIDAMVHAIEAYTSNIKKNPISDMLAIQALKLLSQNIEETVANGSNAAARQNMLLGAMMAGQAFANAPVGAVHALAYPIGGHFHVPHGLSNSLVLPHVLRFNADAAHTLYGELAEVILPPSAIQNRCDSKANTELLIKYFETLINSLNIPKTLREVDIPESALPMMASDSMLQTRLLINNPKPVSEKDALAIYQAAY